jgi:hypothetical protein
VIFKLSDPTPPPPNIPPPPAWGDTMILFPISFMFSDTIRIIVLPRIPMDAIATTPITIPSMASDERSRWILILRLAIS